MGEKILRRRALLLKLSFSSATLHRKIKALEFPPPLRLGPNMCGWLESTVDAYLSSLKADDAIKPVAADSKRGRKPKLQAVSNENLKNSPLSPKCLRDSNNAASGENMT